MCVVLCCVGEGTGRVLCRRFVMVSVLFTYHDIVFVLCVFFDGVV